MKKNSWLRVLKLTVFSVITLFLGGGTAAGWLYNGTLLYPGCPEENTPIKNYLSFEEIHLKTLTGITLRAWYYPSSNGAAVIAAGGLLGSLGNQNPHIEPLLQAGYGILQYDTRACSDPPTQVSLGYYEIYDTRAALDYLMTRPEINPSRIGIIGWSMGGANAIRSAARFQEISAVIAEGNYFNLGQDFLDLDLDPHPGLLRRGLLYTIAGLFWIRSGINPWESSPLDDLPKISPRPVFLIFGEHEVEAGRGFKQFEAANNPKKFWLVPNGSHGNNHIVASKEYNQRIVQFFDEILLRR